MAFNVQYTPFITIWNDKKSCFVLWPGFFGLRPVFGIFLAFFRPKNPKNGPQAKKPGCSTKKLFVLPHVDIVVYFTLKYTISRRAKYSDFHTQVKIESKFFSLRLKLLKIFPRFFLIFHII